MNMLGKITEAYAHTQKKNSKKDNNNNYNLTPNIPTTTVK